MYKYTLCFIKREMDLLMLNREYDPYKGLWNGVGGKLEKGETPLECVIREVKEETDIEINISQIQDKGIITWNFDNAYFGGMYVYLVGVPIDYLYHTPKKTDEGILDWKSVSWLLSDGNYGIDVMIPQVLPKVLNHFVKYEHSFVIMNDKITEYKFMELELEEKA
jgi:8-oxo-dGTP diphosphatase